MLTIEELKALEIGDWIWVIYYKEYGVEKFYAQISSNMSGKYIKHNISGTFVFFEDYGTKWIAYKNKEEVKNNNINQIIRKFSEKLEDKFSKRISTLKVREEECQKVGDWEIALRCKIAYEEIRNTLNGIYKCHLIKY